ncbi:unnamed protein product [Microthlaspi erraticum]|uniref:DNA (cytosine-5-)-methyltransferase n=1 Tax=Microthlaspi erraticum TaxID=1685480 RepID=A0A6D2LCL0_9BRAS|nr:unnamed protein product [Microthlaspi erraticum]
MTRPKDLSSRPKFSTIEDDTLLRKKKEKGLESETDDSGIVKPNDVHEERRLATLDIFAGCGGMTWGLEQAGVTETKWTIEYEEPAGQAFKQNHPVNCNVILRAIMEKCGDQDECVYTTEANDLAAKLNEDQKKAGAYGVSQSRKRAFIWAAAPDEVLPEWPQPMHVFATPKLNISLSKGLRYAAVPSTRFGAPFRPITVRDTIGDLPPVENGESETKRQLLFNIKANFSTTKEDTLLRNKKGKGLESETDSGIVKPNDVHEETRLATLDIWLWQLPNFHQRSSAIGLCPSLGNII